MNKSLHILLGTLLVHIWPPVHTVSDNCDHINVHDGYGNVSKIICDLLKGYDNRLRPILDDDPLRIEMEVQVISLDRVSEVNMDYTLTMYLNQEWLDNRLIFPENSTIDSITLPSSFAQSIWIPDTFIANDKDSTLHRITFDNKLIILKKNGTVKLGMRFSSTLACFMDLHNYPHDEQICSLEIESYGYPETDVNISFFRGDDSIHLSDSMNGTLQYRFFKLGSSVTVKKMDTGNYTRLSVKFCLAREIGFFVYQTYLPCILIVMLSWVSFWINHEATSARIALGITTVLTMTTISTGLRSALPRISYIKAIDIYLVICFSFVFTALLEYAVVNYSFWSNRAKRKPKTKLFSWKNGFKFCQAKLKKSKRETACSKNIELMSSGRNFRYSPLLIHRNMNERNLSGTSPNTALKSDSITSEVFYSNEDDAEILRPLFRVEKLNEEPITSEEDYHENLDYNDIAMTPAILHNSYPLRGCQDGIFRHRAQREIYKKKHRGGMKNLTNSIRRHASKVRLTIPRIREVSTIDQYARVIYPLLFLLFNCVYWAFFTLGGFQAEYEEF